MFRLLEMKIDGSHLSKIEIMSTQSHADKVELKPNLMSYPHHVGAPKIEPVDLTLFNSLQAYKVTKSLQKRADEISMLVKGLQEDYVLNLKLYSAARSFEPVLGEAYHLYEKEDGSQFLSLISPREGTRSIFSKCDLSFLLGLIMMYLEQGNHIEHPNHHPYL